MSLKNETIRSILRLPIISKNQMIRGFFGISLIHILIMLYGYKGPVDVYS